MVTSDRPTELRILPPGNDAERERRWQRAAKKLIRFGLHHWVVGLGDLDCCLRAQDDDMFHTTSEFRLARDYFLLAHLWILGAYEVIRTLAAKLVKQSASEANAAAALKRKFAVVRIPLAKLEAATGQKPGYLSEITEMSGSMLEGWSWHVSPTEWVNRNDLSDQLLKFLESLPDPT